MNYFKLEENGYILAVGRGGGKTPITADEYDAIMVAMETRPAPSPGVDYRLRYDLSWESYTVEAPPEEDGRPTQADYALAARILLGEVE